MTNALPLRGFRTNTQKTKINLNELEAGVPEKDGIPAILNPLFESAEQAQSWLQLKEPVIALIINQTARAYPLQILIWHEIVNDQLAQTPVLVSFCPLCYSALVFKRQINDETFSFGVSGMLRHSDLVMYDHQSESLWQQFSGEAIVGEKTGLNLIQIPSQILSFEQFQQLYPTGEILSRPLNSDRAYGKNPYVGYDHIDQRPFRFREIPDPRLPPMERVIAIQVENQAKAYPYSISRQAKVIHDCLNNRELVIFHEEGPVSAVDQADISLSQSTGSTGVFESVAQGRSLHFYWTAQGFRDRETGSYWDISGKAFSGPLEGERLKPYPHGDFFAFAWLVFRPESLIFASDSALSGT
ncbi:MAG: DUF3179 domain-containing protein [Candidatus Sericytochromatia bacterium]